MTVPAPTHQPTSIRLAALIPGLAVVALGGFVALEVAFGGNGPAPAPAPLTAYGKTTTLEGVVGRLDPLLAPPADVANSVLLPAACVALREIPTGSDATSPSLAYRTTCSATAGWLQAFVLDAVDHEGWTTTSKGTTTHDGGGYAVLAQKAGSDGYYWELGVVVGATTFTPTSSGVPVESTKLTVRIFQSTAQ